MLQLLLSDNYLTPHCYGNYMIIDNEQSVVLLYINISNIHM